MADPRYLFIVGCGRSGTTLVYENVLRTVESYYVTNLEDRWPLSSLVSRVAHSRAARRSGRVVPSEGYGVWDALIPPELDEDDGSRYAAAMNNAMFVDGIREFVNNRLRLHGQSLFVNKNTRNSTRLGLIDAAFPEARFAHIVRHPLAAVNSLLRVNFWKEMPVWFKDGRTVAGLCPTREAEVELAARIWVRETESVHRALDRIAESRWIRISYEDYVEAPKSHLQRIASLAGVEYALAPDYGARSGKNQQFRKQMSSKDIATAEQVVCETAAHHGYELS